MKFLHTPGPWAIEFPARIVSSQHSDHDGSAMLIATVREGLILADQDEKGCTGGNMALIAAAPILLEACIQARAALPDVAFANEKNGEKEVVKLLNHALSLVGE